MAKSGANAKYSWSSFANIEKAVKAPESKNMEEISEALGTGHKVRIFYNNIVNPWHKDNFITIDTHQVAGSLLRPMSGNAKEVLHNFGFRYREVGHFWYEGNLGYLSRGC